MKKKIIIVSLLGLLIILGTGASLWLRSEQIMVQTVHQQPEDAVTIDTEAGIAIFDTHVHYKEPAWTLYSPEEVIALFKATGVIGALVSSTPDDGTRMLYEADSDIVVPFLRPYHDDVTSGNWFIDPSILQYIEKRLDTDIYEGIGEFHIHDPLSADSDVIQRTVKIALERDLYIHVHTNHEAVELLFEMEPDVKILWAHAGMTAPPEAVSSMFDRFKNLWIDTSIRGWDIAPGGRLAPEWKALFLKYPDRITVGSDTWVNSQWERYDSILSHDRTWLSQLPDDIARMIAYENAERLFRQ